MVTFSWQKQYVFQANRAAEILEKSTIDECEHVKGEMNPSDIGTRGITIENWQKVISYLDQIGSKTNLTIVLCLYNQIILCLMTMLQLQ